MREATKEERKSVNNYIESISQKVIIIPNGATNGDVIKTLFPDAWVDDYDYGKDPVVDVYGVDDTEYITVRKNWWDSPYKKEGNEE